MDETAGQVESHGPLRHTSAQACARAIIERLGKDIRLALPLGLGKANRLTNALYEIAKSDPSINLTIFTALTLVRPRLRPGIEARFGEPIVEKLFGNYPDLSYAVDRAKGALPGNVTVEEFFLATGTLLNNAYAQQHYNSVNYTHAMRRIIAADVNVIGQMISTENGRYSLSCNPDLTLDLIPIIRKKGTIRKLVVVGEINNQLPFMPNDAEVSESTFDILLDTEGYDLASLPAPEVDILSHAIGLRAARLIKDGGTLQIGIGSLGDGAAQSIRLRQVDSKAFQSASHALPGPAGPLHEGGDAPFESGLYGCTEMFTQGMLELLKAGVFSRYASDQRKILIDGGFFLGPQKFYDDLNAADPEVLSSINMTSVGSVNALYGDEMTRRRERRDARFINIAMKVTCLGAVTSDALEDGRIVGGVGGQYNFVAQAHELEGARSIILVKAVRNSDGKAESNIVWSYGNTTVPRHLRDIVITEYGVADLRGQTDEECVRRMLAITDARFIDGLIEKAIAARKLPAGFAAPQSWRDNTPATIRKSLAPYIGVLPSYPFGTELSQAELELSVALNRMKSRTRTKFSTSVHVLKAFFGRRRRNVSGVYNAHLERLGLEKPQSLQDRMLQSLVLYCLEK